MPFRTLGLFLPCVATRCAHLLCKYTDYSLQNAELQILLYFMESVCEHKYSSLKTLCPSSKSLPDFFF